MIKKGSDKRANPKMKENILRQAINLFLHKGYRGTTIEDITDSVSITKGAFYWHFKSKDQLLQTIIEHYDTSFVDEFIKIIDSLTGSFLTKYKHYHKYITEFALNNRELCVGFMTLSAELAGSGSEIEQKINAIYLKHLIFLNNLIELGKKEGSISMELDADLTAHAIMAINNGALLEWYMHQNKINGQLFAKTYRDLILKGVLHRNLMKNERKDSPKATSSRPEVIRKSASSREVDGKKSDQMARVKLKQHK
jgi:AcrR family transcriptional regulator